MIRLPKNALFRYSHLIFFLLFFIYLIFSIPSLSQIFIYFYDKDSIKCYRYKGDTLPDINLVNVRKDKSIFFHETSCNSYINGKIVINSRQACAVESAALLHPNLDVYLLFTSPGIFVSDGSESDRFLSALLTYDNIKFHHLNYESYIKDTPVEELYTSGRIERSNFALSHASDVLRYLTLWKYGGTYLDLDIIVIKSLESLPFNFAGCESRIDVAAGIINFEHNGTGHRLAEKCLMDLKQNFSGTIWGHNGPGVITRLTKEVCKSNSIDNIIGKNCDDFRVYPPEMFYSIEWRKWKSFFNEQDFAAVMNKTRDSYFIHVWNKHSWKEKLPLDSKSAYLTFAKKFCPKVYEQCDYYF